jgi:hypothetical protein
MTVPTHNLYDFVHQVLENKFCLAYYYPYGAKDLSSMVSYQGQNFGYSDTLYSTLDKTLTIAPNHIVAKKILPDHLITVGTLEEWNTRLLCHDQEPLDYNYYQKTYTFTEYYKNINTKRTEYEHNHVKNLRIHSPGNKSKKWILLHSELNSDEVKKYQSTDQFAPAYWWSHVILSLDWYRFAKSDKRLNLSTNFKKLFLLYARDTTGTRSYRQNLIELITNNNLASVQLGSFNGLPSSSNQSAEYNFQDINQSAIQCCGRNCV